MKKNILMVMSLAMLIIAGTVSASAQITDRLVANIPFEFSVRDKTLPAGKYYIKSLDTYDEGVFEMQNAQGKQVAVFLSENATARTMPEKTKLIFDRVGDHYFLSEIFESGNTQGIALEAVMNFEREKPYILPIMSVRLPSLAMPSPLNGSQGAFSANFC